MKKAGLEEHSPRKAVEFLMNQMKQYAKRYISMCPAQLRRKKHSEVKYRNSLVTYVGNGCGRRDVLVTTRRFW